MIEAATGYICPRCAGKDRASIPVAAGHRATRPLGVALLAAPSLVLAIVMVLQGGAAGGSTEIARQLALFGPAVAFGEWWRLITSNFLHYGLVHLALNMYGLFILGGGLEHRLGTVRLLLLAFVAMAFDGLAVILFQPDALTAGFSGVVFGLIAAAVLLERRRGTTSLMGSFPGRWLLLGIFTSFIPGVSIAGHLGGAIGGAAAAWILFATDRHDRRRNGNIAATALGLAAFGLALVFA